ncbi:MAG: hypothetical protein P1P88_04480 [Bacteroidales bacterium]|nr:hypothetical protein [Bacteroidales bacterium]
MQTTLSYIYNKEGLAEYVVIPVEYWENLKVLLKSKLNTETEEDKNNFNPQDYFGVISHLKLNVEDELKNMRKEWNRSI